MNNLFWTTLKFKNEDICPNFEIGSQFTFIKDLNIILYFGDNFKKNNENVLLSKNVENNIWLYYIENNTWEMKETSGRKPIKRIYYETIYYNKMLFLLGGKNVKGKIINDFYILNLDNFIWKRIFQLDGPRARIFPGIGFYEEEFYLFGGIMLPDKTICTDIWKANFENIPWDSNVLELPGINWIDISNNDFKFLNISFFGYIFVENGVYIFGGFTKKEEPINRIFYFDINGNTIEEIFSGGEIFSPRGGLFLKKINENMIILSGGFKNIDDKLSEDYSNQMVDIYLFYINEKYFLKPIIGGVFPKNIYFFETNLENILICGNIIEKDKYIHILKESSENYKIEKIKKVENNDNILLQTEEIKKENDENVEKEEEDEFRKYEEHLIKIRSEYNIMEMNYKNEILKNENSKIRINKLKIEMEDIIKEYNEKYSKNEEIIKEKEKKIENNKLIINKLKDFYLLKKKLRKLKEFKIKKLQNLIYENEKFLVLLDDFITKSIQNDIIINYLSKKEYNNLIKLKLEHKEYLIKLKDFINIYLNKKQKIVKSIKLTKNKLNDNTIKSNFKKIMKNDKKYLNFN